MSAPAKTPLVRDDFSKCVKIIESIESDPSSVPFHEPVAWKELGLLDYPKIISRPMDLATLKQNLLDAKFESYEDFLADL